jgi:hypothetical protein
MGAEQGEAHWRSAIEAGKDSIVDRPSAEGRLWEWEYPGGRGRSGQDVTWSLVPSSDSMTSPGRRRLAIDR